MTLSRFILSGGRGRRSVRNYLTGRIYGRRNNLPPNLPPNLPQNLPQPLPPNLPQPVLLPPPQPVLLPPPQPVLLPPPQPALLVRNHEIFDSEAFLPDILVKLSVKYLLQYKLVNRLWNDTISAQYFVKMKNQQVEKPAGVFFLHPLLNDEELEGGFNVQTQYVPFHLHLNEGRVHNLRFGKEDLQRSALLDIPIPNVMVDSCNGLVLSLSFGYNNTEYELLGDIIVFNPTTRAYRHVAWPAANRFQGFQVTHVEAVNLVFDPRQSEYFTILVVCLNQRFIAPMPTDEHDHRTFTVSLYRYESATGVWDYIVHETVVTDVMFGRGVYKDDWIFWPSRSDRGWCLNVKEVDPRVGNDIIPFEMPASEAFQQFGIHVVNFFGVVGDQLVSVVQREEGSIIGARYFQVFERLDGVWGLKYNVDLLRNRAKPIYVIKVGDEDLIMASFPELYFLNRLMIHNCRTRISRYHCAAVEYVYYPCGHMQHPCLPYIPSLSPVDP